MYLIRDVNVPKKTNKKTLITSLNPTDLWCFSPVPLLFPNFKCLFNLRHKKIEGLAYNVQNDLLKTRVSNGEDSKLDFLKHQINWDFECSVFDPPYLNKTH